MGRTRPSGAEGLTRYHYEEAAQLAMRNQSLEDIMEATPQATQRKITLASLDLVRAHRPDFQVFNELLVQYPEPGTKAIQRVVPDNMVVLHDEDLGPLMSFNLPLMPAPPFWVMEYVSASSKRKDYDESFRKYERELKVPYYLIFYPDNEELTLYRLNERQNRYDTVLPDDEGRCAVSEVDIAVSLVDGWTRFWYKGRLLPLPAELDRELQETRAELDRERQRADGEKQRADRLAARLRAMGLDPEE
jgi:Uma2 family endonuclease